MPREKSFRDLGSFCPFSSSVLPQRPKEQHFTLEDFLPWVLYVTMPIPVSDCESSLVPGGSISMPVFWELG